MAVSQPSVPGAYSAPSRLAPVAVSPVAANQPRPVPSAPAGMGNFQQFRPSQMGPGHQDPRAAVYNNSGSRGGDLAVQGPRNYREYRMMKEESERRRREREERYQAEMQRCYEREQQKQLQQKQQLPADVGKSGSSDSRIQDVDKNSSTAAGNVDVKDLSSNAKAVDIKGQEAKDHVRKPLDQAEEKKAMEQVKSFKIPKVKKAEPAEVCPLVNKVSENADPKEIVRSQLIDDKRADSCPVKVEAKDVASSVDSGVPTAKQAPLSRKTSLRKFEKFITKEDIPSLSAEKVAAVPVDAVAAASSVNPPAVVAAAVRKAFSEDSDSDQGALTIAEDHVDMSSAVSTADSKMDIFPPATAAIEPSAEGSKVESDRPADAPQQLDHQADQSRRDEQTKELLKNIVATLDPAEARKLILKAKGLEKMENFTLRELKEFLSVPSVKKAKKKKKKKKKTAAAAACLPEEPPSDGLAIRRSGRLKTETIVRQNQPEEDDEEMEPSGRVVDSDSEVETFVIEPKEMKRKIRRNGKKKGGGLPPIGEDKEDRYEAEEDLQDSAVTSSNIVEGNNSGESNNAIIDKIPGAGAVVVIKTEPLDEEAMAEESLVSPRLRRTRARTANSGNVPVLLPKKTKTWYPGNVKMESKGCLANFINISDIKAEPGDEGGRVPVVSIAASGLVVLKKEPLPDPDLAVFTGQGPVASADFACSGYEYNSGSLDARQATAIRQRHAQVSDIFLKLKMKSQEAVLQRRATPLPTATIATGLTEPPATASSPLPSKIRLSRPPLDAAGRPLDPPALVAELALAPPEEQRSAQARLISRLLAQTVGSLEGEFQRGKKTVSVTVEDEESQSRLDGPGSRPGLLRVVKEIRWSVARNSRPLPALVPIVGEEEQARQLPVRPSHLLTNCFSTSKVFSKSSLAEFKSVQVE